MRDQTRMLPLTALLAALTAVGAFLRIPLGSMSLTLQFFFTALAGVLLGPKWGAASQAAYVALGLAGLPIFTLGGGLGYILRPSFGFLVGLIPAAALIGALTRGRPGTARVVLASAAGLGVLYLVGLPYLYLIQNAYLGRGLAWPVVVWTGMLVYLPGDALKIAALAVVCRPLCRALGRGAAPAA